MKITIWVNKSDIVNGKITKHYNICPQGSNWPDYYQVTIDRDEFAQLLDRDMDYTYPEFVKMHYDKPTPDIVKKYMNTSGGDFQEFWNSLTKEEQITITKYYDR